jgi:general stress protein 26
MISLTSEMRDHIDNALANRKSCLLVTATATGYPGVGYRGSLLVYDDEHLAFWERTLGSGLEHIRENPHVVVIYRDPDSRIGWRFYGDAHVHDEGPIREQVWERAPKAETDRDPDKKGVAVLIRVDRIMNFGDTVIQGR